MVCINTCWVVALAENGVVKHFDCNDIILSTNYTYGLNLIKNSNHPDFQENKAIVNGSNGVKKE